MGWLVLAWFVGIATGGVFAWRWLTCKQVEVETWRENYVKCANDMECWRDAAVARAEKAKAETDAATLRAVQDERRVSQLQSKIYRIDAILHERLEIDP